MREVSEAQIRRLLLALSSRGGSGKASPEAMREALARGLVEMRAGRPALSSAGRSALRRQLAEGDDGFAAQHQTRVTLPLDEAGSRRISVNLDESPLARLRRQHGRDGRPLIDAVQFEAGERLRADFTRGQMQPRMTASWDPTRTVSAGSAQRGAVALGDAALAARLRVEKALAAIEPEFADLLVDFCCFLKGIEEIERNRGWPVRSAKLVLALSLNALARHYGLASRAEGPAKSGLRHWGTEDYRPNIS